MKTLNSILILLLTACSTPAPVPPPVVLAPAVQTINIPDALLKTCPPFNKLGIRAYQQGDVVAIDKTWIDQYEACRTSQNILVNTVKKAFNIVTPVILAPSK